MLQVMNSSTRSLDHTLIADEPSPVATLHSAGGVADLGAAALPLVCTVGGLVALGALHLAPANPTAPPDLLAVLAVTIAVTIATITIVGLTTLGTFTPALVATSIVSEGVAPTLVVLALVLSFALVAEAVMHAAHLPRIGRLGVLVAGACVVLSVADDVGVVGPSIGAGALPVVASMMALERWWKTAEAEGVVAALQLLGGTVAVIAVCVLFAVAPIVRATSVTSPIAVTAAALGVVMMTSAYQGLRVTELGRFAPTRPADIAPAIPS